MFANSGGAVTVRTILELEIFGRAETFVATGEDELDRPVRWVHAAEIPDIARFLSGGEVLLTAGHGMGTSESDQRRYVASVAEVGVAALAVELGGRAFNSLPDVVVEEARSHGLPLLGLRHEVPFIEASAQVLELLIETSVRDNARSVEFNHVLTECLLAGSDYITLVRRIAQNLDHPIVLESASHEVQAYFSEREEPHEVLTDWPVHARSRHLHVQEGEHPTCLRCPVIVQGATWGWLHMPLDGAHRHLDQVLLHQGASAVAISLLNERVQGTTSRHQQGNLVNRLMLGDVSGAGFVDRALRLGRDLRRSTLVVVIAGDAVPGASAAALERQVSSQLAETGLLAVTADIGEAVLAVVALGPASRSDKALARLVRTLRHDERVLGLSKDVEPDELPMAIQQARAAFYARQPCQFFDHLGILRLLVPLANGPELSSYVEDELGALLTYDTRHDGRLYPTLVAYLEADGNKTIAATKLFIQRRTLYYRLDRISQVLGLSLDDTDVRLRLMVAVQAAGLLRSTRGTRGLRQS